MLLDLPVEQPCAVAARLVERELDARRAGIEHGDAACVRGHLRRQPSSRAPCERHSCARRAAATSTATAQEASRVSSKSARLVRMIGTRAPSTMPAASAPARNDRLLASMLPASRSGTISTLARPATGETMCLIAAASGLMALSSASGPSSTAPVIWPRSAILHSAAASIVDGTLGVDGLHRAQDGDAHFGRRPWRGRGRSRSARCRP